MSIQAQKQPRKITTLQLQRMKGVEPIAMITAYDALIARLFDGQVEMILVGDSLNMSFFGASDTLSATMDQMLYHTKAVCNGAKSSMVVFDMPFGSYDTPHEALKNASRVYQETEAQAVKIEGGKERASIIKALSEHGIAVIAHIGLMPQFVRSEGGYRVRGKDSVDTQRLIEDAKILEEAGAFIVLIEGVKSDAAKAITQSLRVPTIGIGAGNDTDGQVLVWSDMFGFFEAFTPKFVKKYGDGATMIREGVARYQAEVKSRAFPNEKYWY